MRASGCRLAAPAGGCLLAGRLEELHSRSGVCEVECPVCGRYAPPCPDTGYDGDDVCTECSKNGFTINAAGEVVNEHVIEVPPGTMIVDVGDGAIVATPNGGELTISFGTITVTPAGEVVTDDDDDGDGESKCPF